MIYRAKGTLCNQKKISRLESLGSKPWAHFSKPRLDTCGSVSSSMENGYFLNSISWVVLFRFSQRPNLKKHLLESHAGGGQALVGQTYPCPTCSILFRTREDLAQHILKQVGQLKQFCHVYLRERTLWNRKSVG